MLDRSIPPLPSYPTSETPRVLLVDDDPMVRSVVGSLLETAGWEAIHAGSGEEAATLLISCREKHVPIDAAIMDIVMPGGMSGLEALQQLRAIDPGLPVIASSGFFDLGVDSVCAELGFNAVLCKPFSLAQISDTLNRFKRPDSLAA